LLEGLNARRSELEIARSSTELMGQGLVVAPLADRRVDPAASEKADLSLRRMEERHILDVFAQMGGCKRRTARALGVSRSTLDRKLMSFNAGVRVGIPALNPPISPSPGNVTSLSISDDQ
jgi:DNA-binding NtrC family response regulator